MDFRIFIWVDDVSNRFKVSSYFRQELDRMFEEARIEILFPQREIAIKQEKKKGKEEPSEQA